MKSLALNTIVTAALSVSLAFAAAAPAFAENWYPFYMVPSGVAYVDKDSVIIRPGHVAARTEASFPEPKSVQREGQTYTFTRSKDLIDIDCAANVFRYVGRDLYNDAGVLVLAVNEADNPLLIANGSPEGVLAKSLCPEARKKKG